MNNESPDSTPGFAPSNPTDGREKGEWQSRYDDKAWKHIRHEAIYLGCMFILVMASTSLLALDVLDIIEDHSELKKYFYAWLGGTLGGVLFSVKWLYHSVAKNIWNYDRRLWRIFTPHLSGALGLIIILLIASGILSIFDEHSLNAPKTAYGLGFLIGYFSDAAMGKLSELASTFFGSTNKSSSKN